MEVDELFRKLRPALGKRIDDLWLEYQLRPQNRKDIEGLLNVLAMQHLGQTLENTNPLLLPPDETTARGRYEMGAVVYGNRELYRFGLRETEMIQHLAIFGRTGSGKTNVSHVLLDQLVKQKKPFMVFDWKRSYRDLLAQPSFENLRVFTVGRDVVPFSFNPLSPPPGTSRTTWAKKLVEIMCHVYFLGDGVAYLLQKAVDAVDREGATLADIKAWLESYKARGRQAQWMDSALRLVGTLCHGGTGAMVAAHDNALLTSLLHQQVVFELDALNDNDKTFFIDAVLLWIHHYRLNEPTRETFKHALVIEEAHHVLLRRTEGRETIPDLILREIRELGEAVILIDQHPSLISIPALGNTHTTIAMNLKHGRDLSALREALQLSESEESWLTSLEVGTGIVKLQSRYDKPFLVRFPLMNVSKGDVTDEKLSEQTVTDSARSEPVPPSPPVQAVITPIPVPDKKGVSDSEWKVLCDVIAHPSSPIAARFRRLAVSPRAGGRIIESLLASGRLSSHVLKTPTGQMRFLQLTPNGEQLCRLRGVAVPSFKKGGPEHEYWRAVVADELKGRGWTVDYEVAVTENHAADIVATKEARRMIVEIETGKSGAAANVRCDLNSDATRIVSVALDAGLSASLKSEFAKEDQRRLRILTPSEFGGFIAGLNETHTQ
ncbi:MAG: conjugal transfer ATP-binding protein TraC [Bacteroidetes bacterium]|nr:conjugal transfer ATP-binding protein TraC [Bacteroidota bacterium]